MPPPELPGVKVPKARPVPVLTERERRRLLASYDPRAARVALVLAYQGSRTDETLALDSQRVDWLRGTIWFVSEGTKSAKGRRTVPMRPKVSLMLWGLWQAAGRPQSGPVFLSSPRSPLRRPARGGRGQPARRGARRGLPPDGDDGFRVHDWAARMVMAGVDLNSLVQLGGWEGLRMVQRYVAVTGEHLRGAAGRIA